MTAPLSYDRVLGALRRLFAFPVKITRPGGALPAPGDSSIGREIGSIAWMGARAMDRGDAMYAELFPDTTVETIDRWERNTLRPVNPPISLDERRARVLAVLRRSGGVQPDGLAEALYAVLDLDSPDQIIFFETLRAQIDAALTLELPFPGIVLPSIPPAVEIGLGKPWPGVVDDLGVQVYIQTTGPGTVTATVTSPSGTIWNIGALPSLTGQYENRITFLGEDAGGTWKVGLINSVGGNTLEFVSIRVSNDVDSAQIYNFFVYRDMSLPGTPDIQEAQRIVDHTALAHMSPSVTTNEACVVDINACDTEPVE